MVKILTKKSEALKNRYFKKIIATCLAIIGFSLFFSTNVYADTTSFGFPNMYRSQFTYSTNNGSSYSTSVGAAPVSSYANWRVWNGGAFAVSSIRSDIQSSSPIEALSYTVNLDLTVYATGTDGHHYYSVAKNCGYDMYALIGAYDENHNLALEPSFSSITINTCEIKSNGQLHIVISSTFQFDDLQSVSWFSWDILNPAPNNSVPGNGWIFSCGSYTSDYPCSATSWFGLSEFNFSVEYTADDAVAIMKRQLAIQQEEQAHRKQLEENAGQALDTGNDDAGQASQDASTFTTNYLDVLIRLRDFAINVHTTDCVLHFPNANGLTPMGGNFGLGSIDFCALSVPAPIMSIASLAIFWLMVKLAIWVIRQFYETFEEMLVGGGGK